MDTVLDRLERSIEENIELENDWGIWYGMIRATVSRQIVNKIR